MSSPRNLPPDAPRNDPHADVPRGPRGQSLGPEPDARRGGERPPPRKPSARAPH